MNSIRSRLSLCLTSTILALAVVEGMLVYRYVRTSTQNNFDAALTVRVRTLASLLRIDQKGVIELDFSNEAMPEFQQGKNAEYFQAFLPDGRTFRRSSSLRDLNLVDPRQIDPDKGPWDLKLPDGRPGRAVALKGTPHSEAEDLDESPTAEIREANRAVAANAPAVLFVVARDRSDLNQTSSALLFALILSTTSLAAACLLLVRLIVRRELRPLDRLTSEAAAIDAETLKHRFSAGQVADELQPIYACLNELFSRLDSAFKRERRITADIAHELRTPIAELRSLSEVARIMPIDVHQLLAYMEDVRDVSLRMERVVEVLLAMARSQTPRGELHLEPVELAPLAHERFERTSGEIKARHIRLNFPSGSQSVVITERAMITRILDNLISNAVHYTRDGGTIDCQIEEDPPGSIRLRISNTSTGLEADDLKDIFEPFWRKDASRSEAEKSGLGLALVREYAKLLGLHVEARIPQPNLFEIIVEFPACSAPPASVASSAVSLPS